MIRPHQSPALVTAAVLVGAIGVLYFARDVLIPLALAIIVAMILAPAVGQLQKLHIPRFPSALLAMSMFLAATGAITYVIFNQLVEVVNELPAYRDNINRKLTTLREPHAGALGRAAENVKQLGNELAPPSVAAAATPPVKGSRPPVSASNPLPVQLVEPAPNELVYIRELAQPFLGPLATVGIVLVFSLFLLAEKGDVRNRVFRLAGLNRLNVMTQAMEDGTRRISRYLMLQFLVNACFGAVVGMGLFLIGVPYAALWGTLAGLLRIVPYAGSMAAALLPLMLSLAVFDGWRAPLLVLALFVTLEVITGNLIEPRLYGAHTGMSSLALLVTTVFWAVLWGPAGLVLSTPLTVCVVVLGRHVRHLSFLHILLGDQPVLTPDAHLYQRLLAMDGHEAHMVADQYRNENSVIQLYDSVIIPALTMAEQDRHKGALDADREEFLFVTVREIIADVVALPQRIDPERLPEEVRQPATTQRVLCIPANDEADEVAAGMLAQLLEFANRPVIAVPLSSSAMNMLVVIEPTADDIFCVSAVQPYAFSHARTLSRELRAKYPRTKTVVGIWGFSGDVERALLRFQPAPPDSFLRNLAEATNYFGIDQQNPGLEVPR